MDRTPRLRRNTRKDYSQLVDFPVEIVGRDHQIRRFSYDESVRLYHRRIASAALRYDEPEVIDAEVHHCRARVEQLRRSFLEHHGWHELRSQQTGTVCGTPLAAEIAAFLRRVFVEEVETLATLGITRVEGEGGDACFLQFPESGHSYTLYAWRLDAAGREAADRVKERLLTAPLGEGVERALVAWECPDVALVLAGSTEWSGPQSAEVLDPEDAPATAGRDPWLDAMRALFDGRIPVALAGLEAGADRQPGRRVLTQAAALVCLLDQQPERAELDARYGLLHHPGDALLSHLLLVALCRSGRLAEARALLPAHVAAHEQQPLAILLEATFALRSLRVLRAWRRYSELYRRAGNEGRFVARATLAGLVVILRGASGLVLGLALMAAGVVEPLLAVSGLALGAAGLLWMRAQASAALCSGRSRRLRVISTELMPRDRRVEGGH